MPYPLPIKQLVPIPLPRAPGDPQSALCLHGVTYSRHFIQMGSSSLWPFVSGFFSLSIVCLRFIHNCSVDWYCILL